MASTINSLLKRTAKDAAIYLPSMVLPAVLGIVFLRVFTTLLTPEEYGHYNISLATIGLIKVFSVIWLSSSAIRFYPRYKKQTTEQAFLTTLFISSWASAFLFAAVSFVLLSIAGSNLENPLRKALQITIFASVVTTVFEIVINLYRSSFQAKKYSLYWALYTTGKPIIGVALILLTGMKADGLFWGFFAAPFILLIFPLKDFGFDHTLRFSAFSPSIVKEFAAYGFPMMLTNFSLWMLTLSDRYLLNFFTDSSQVGLYGLGYSIPEKILQFSFMTLMLAAYPVIIENWETKGPVETRKLISAMSRYYLILLTPLLVCLIALPRQILVLLADVEFARGADVIPFIAGGLYLLGLSQYVQKGLELKQKTSKIAYTAFISGICNILFNLFLIPKMGFKGAGIACFSSYVIYFISAFLFSHSELKWHLPKKSALNVLLGAICMLSFQRIIMRFYPESVPATVFAIAAGAAIFFVFLFALGELEGEAGYLKQFMRKLYQ